MNEPARSSSTPPESFGRYLLYPAIAHGGMATVHTARLVGAEGFTRLVAAKRLHPQFTDDPDFVTMFHDEACIASRIHHPNVVPVLDVVLAGHELILVQEYVHGVPLAQLLKIAHTKKAPIPIDVVVAILSGVLAGLHAAHEVKDELEHPLEIVHRDVSPQNVMVSVDGIPRLLDFGIAKARTSTHHTREGVFKGKLAYMAPEQLRMDPVDRTVDVYATGVLAWEMLVNRRVYDGRHELAFVTAVMNGEIPSLRDALRETRAEIDDARWELLGELDAIVMRAISPAREDRFATASEMMLALVAARLPATSMEVAEWVRSSGAEYLDQRQRTLAANEESWRRTSIYTPTPISGTERLTPAPSGALLVVDAPSASGIGGSAADSRSSAPPSVTAPSAAPQSESGEYRVALGMTPLGARLRSSRALPWLTAGSFIVAVVVGGVLRGATEAPAAGGASDVAPAGPVPTGLFAVAPNGPIPVATTAPGAAQASSPAGQEALLPTPASSPALTFARQSHPPAPTPPPPRPVWVPRPTSAPAPQQAPATTQASSPPTPTPKVDCNPPFYFDGPKKVFKPSCL